MKRYLLFTVFAFIIASFLTGQAPEITSSTLISSGLNFDAAVANDKIYLISDNYYELDLEGNIIYTNENVNDIKQGVFDFHPALDVGSDKVVHVIHRLGDKTRAEGFELNYSKRDAGGVWSIENQVVGSEQSYNYVIDIVAMDDGNAVDAHSKLTSSTEPGDIIFYKLNGSSVDPWGGLGTNVYYRIDVDFRISRFENTLHLVTGRCDKNG